VLFFDGNDNTHERDRIQCAHRSHGYVGSHDESVSISCPKVLAKSPSRVGLEGQLTWREKCCLRRRFRQTSTPATFCNSHEEHQTTIFFQTSTSETRTRRNRCQNRRLQQAASQRLFFFFGDVDFRETPANMFLFTAKAIKRCLRSSFLCRHVR
jgi:hypothetical protein